MSSSWILIDGDIVAYRCAYSCKDLSLYELYLKLDEVISYIINECSFFCDKGDYTIFLTGKGNFRFDIAKTAIYKGNRKDTPKPPYLEPARQYLLMKYNTIMSQGEEADDLIGIAATKVGKGAIVASIDKDMLQIPATHFNFNRNEWKFVTEAEGMRFFYAQILAGDNADNIIGLYRVGMVTAYKMLEEANTEQEMWDTVVKAYDGNTGRVIENARLLWLRRKEGETWHPPVAQKQKGD
jgi:5'-3' exonuclease